MVLHTERLLAELRRLEDAPCEGERPDGAGTVSFLAACPEGAARVRTRAMEVIRVVDEAALCRRSTREDFAARLPRWFTAVTGTAMTPAEENRWLARRRRLPPAERLLADENRAWSLDAWLFWMEPSGRQWFWWRADLGGSDQLLLVTVTVEAWPCPWGALRWLIRAAGGVDLRLQDALGISPARSPVWSRHSSTPVGGAETDPSTLAMSVTQPG